MDYPVLCGGTFFTLLLQARKQRRQYRTYIKGKNEEYSDSNMFFELLKIVKPDYIEQPKNSFKTATSKYKNCSQSKSAYIPLDESWVIDIFDKNIKEDYEKFLGTMVNFVEKFIASNEDTKIKLISSYLELIQQDKSIQSTDIFYVCSNGQALSKADMSDSHCEILELYLPSFLLGIWHFIVLNRSDNSIGKDTYNSWHEEQEKGSKVVRKYIGTIGENYKRQIAIITDTSESKSKDLTQDNLPLERISDNCLKEKECSSSKSSPTELVSNKVEETSLHTEAPATLNKTQKLLAPDVSDEISDNDASDDSSLNNETTGTLVETALPNSDETDLRTDSDGAQLSIPDEYRRCVFCIKWKGNTSYAYKSKTGVPGICKMYEREQISTDGIDCRYYEPDYGRISCKEIVKPMSFLLQ